MTTETSFNPDEVEPAMVNFIKDDNNVNEEQLDTDTLDDAKDKQEADQQNAPKAEQVQASPQDSEVYKNLQAHFTKVSQENSELRNENVQLKRELTEKSTIPEPVKPVGFEEVDKIAEDFEELKPIASSMKNMQQQLAAQQAAMTQQQQNIDSNNQQNAEQVRIDTITRAHSDAIALTNSFDFQGWLARQPSYMQTLMPMGPAREIIDLINAYKSSLTGQVVPNNLQQQNIDAARLASVPDNNSPVPKLTTDSNKRIYSNAEIGAMSYREYAALSDDIDVAMMEGRITV